MKMNKDAEWKFTFNRRSLDYTNARWICTYEDGIKDAEWKFTFTEEVWIILTRGRIVPMKMNKRCRMEIYIPKEVWIIPTWGGFVPTKMIKEAEWKFTFTEEVWIIPTCGGFVPMKMNKRCTREAYISPRGLDYTNARWICTYEDK